MIIIMIYRGNIIVQWRINVCGFLGLSLRPHKHLTKSWIVLHCSATNQLPMKLQPHISSKMLTVHEHCPPPLPRNKIQPYFIKLKNNFISPVYVSSSLDVVQRIHHNVLLFKEGIIIDLLLSLWTNWNHRELRKIIYHT